MIDLNNKNIFLAGSTGLAGTSILRYITKHYPDAQIRAVYHNTKPVIEHKNVEYVRGDLRSLDQCRTMARNCGLAVMTAANTGGSFQLINKPWKQVNDNIFMNSQMLEAFYLEKIKRVIYVGSATLYQEFENSITESEIDYNCDPPPAYMGIGWVNRYIEKLCTFWHNQSDMEILISRTANIFGPYAKFDSHSSNFIPAIIRKAIDKMEPFEVWGSPDVVRDIIYAEDFAVAIVSLLIHNEIKFDVFNVGSGIATRVGDVVEWTLDASGHKPKSLIYNSNKPTTAKSRILDCSKIQKAIKWKPKHHIKQSIEKTIEWWRDNKNWWKK